MHKSQMSISLKFFLSIAFSGSPVGAPTYATILAIPIKDATCRRVKIADARRFGAFYMVPIMTIIGGDRLVRLDLSLWLESRRGLHTITFLYDS